MKTQDLLGAQLDWAVAKAKGTLGQKPDRCFDCKYYEERQGSDDAIQYCHHPKMDFEDGSGALRVWPSDYETHEQCPITSLTAEPFSTDWNLAGPIIEQEGINLTMFLEDEVDPEDVGNWCAAYDRENLGDDEKSCTASTPLIAAMRCYVASKLGAEVEVPDELAN